MEPRFAKIGSVEEQYARRWKALYDLEKEQREQLERNIQNERTQLESEMENFERDHKSMMLKEGSFQFNIYMVFVVILKFFRLLELKKRKLCFFSNYKVSSYCVGYELAKIIKISLLWYFL